METNYIDLLSIPLQQNGTLKILLITYQ